MQAEVSLKFNNYFVYSIAFMPSKVVRIPVLCSCDDESMRGYFGTSCRESSSASLQTVRKDHHWKLLRTLGLSVEHYGDIHASYFKKGNILPLMTFHLNAVPRFQVINLRPKKGIMRSHCVERYPSKYLGCGIHCGQQDEPS